MEIFEKVYLLVIKFQRKEKSRLNWQKSTYSSLMST